MSSTFSEGAPEVFVNRLAEFEGRLTIEENEENAEVSHNDVLALIWQKPIQDL